MVLVMVLVMVPATESAMEVDMDMVKGTVMVDLVMEALVDLEVMDLEVIEDLEVMVDLDIIVDLDTMVDMVNKSTGKSSSAVFGVAYVMLYILLDSHPPG